jgi:hypothetical protein
MDIFDVLRDISKRRTEFICKGMDEYNALKNAELNTSEEYHIPLCDIKRLCGA